MLMQSTLQLCFIQLNDACKHEGQMTCVSMLTCMQQKQLSGMTLPLISAFFFSGSNSPRPVTLKLDIEIRMLRER